MTPEEEEIQQLLTEIELKKNAVRAQFTKNERKSIIEMVIAFFQLIAVILLLNYKPCLQYLNCRSPSSYHWYYSNDTFYGYWYYDWFYDVDMSRFGDVKMHNISGDDGISWHEAVDYCRAQNAQLCSFDHYCPNGLHGDLSGVVNESLSETQLTNDFWMPHGDLFNGYVQVGVWSGNDLHHDGKRCFTNPWGHTWGLNRISSIDQVCCVYDAPDMSYHFCESGWYQEDKNKAMSTCYGWTTNYHYHHLVLNDTGSYGRYQIELSRFPAIIGLSDNLNHNEVNYELGIGEEGYDGLSFVLYQRNNLETDGTNGTGYSVLDFFSMSDVMFDSTTNVHFGMKLANHTLELWDYHFHDQIATITLDSSTTYPNLWVSSGWWAEAGTDWEIRRIQQFN